MELRRIKNGINIPQTTELKSTNYGKIIHILRNFQGILCYSTNYLYLYTHESKQIIDMTDFKYKPRIAESILLKKLKSSGAVLVEGPKWCGKTTTSEHLLSEQ